jgi:hypothetical protein
MEEQAQYTPQPLMQSPDIGKLSEALAKAQAEMEPATKDANNPFFKSQYATLASCWQACRGPLTKHGLAVIQTTEPDNGNVTVISMLTHSSGQWVKGKLSVKPDKAGSQALGSCMSYLRRYSLSAMVGLSTQDDDAEGTMSRGKPAAGKPQTVKNPSKKAAVKTEKPSEYTIAMRGLYNTLGEDVFMDCLKDNGIGSLDAMSKTKDPVIQKKLLESMEFLAEKQKAA